MKKTIGIVTILCALFAQDLGAQQISRDELIYLTPEWKGERFDDGRPRVSDDIKLFPA